MPSTRGKKKERTVGGKTYQAGGRQFRPSFEGWWCVFSRQRGAATLTLPVGHETQKGFQWEGKRGNQHKRGPGLKREKSSATRLVMPGPACSEDRSRERRMRARKTTEGCGYPHRGERRGQSIASRPSLAKKAAATFPPVLAVEDRENMLGAHRERQKPKS